MARTNTLGNFLTDVADAIRTKKGTSGTIPASDFDTEIASIPTGADLTEYFETNPSSTGFTSNNWARDNFIKKTPDLTIPSGITQLNSLFNLWQGAFPKVICTNIINTMQRMYGRNSESFDYNNCSKATTIDLTGLNTSNVSNMEGMFSGLYNLTSLDFTSFNVEKVTNMSYMFSNCTHLTSLDLSSFTTSQLTNSSYMFTGCSAITSLNLGTNFDTSKITTMEGMFQSIKMTSLDLSSFVTTALTNTMRMFYNCTNLATLDLRNFDFTNVSSYQYMFGRYPQDKVPVDCLIIVKDDTAKTWITSNFTDLTNVKTVAEYEASLNN